MAKYEIKTCPRCDKEFKCESSAMFLCACNSVQLSEQILEELTDTYEECLCLDCLKNIEKHGI